MSKEIEYLLNLIKAAIKDQKPCEPPSGIDWGKVWLIAYEHSIISMAYYAISKLDSKDKPPKEIEQLFVKEYKIQLILDAKREYEINQLTNCFAKCDIDYMLLKGIVINKLYPISAMRSMSDVDILYREKEKNSIAKCMKEKGYELTVKSYKDDTYVKKESGIKIELHRALVEYSMNHEYKYLNSVWKTAVSDGHAYRMTAENFYVYMIIHFAKHFYKSGVGIRQVADIWVFNNKYRNTIDKEYIDKELRKLNLKIFESKIRELSEVWFNCVPQNDNIRIIGDYVISSGVFGTTDRLEENLLVKEKIKNHDNKSKLSYYMKNIFPPYRIMVGQYGRWIKKFPFLLPIAWIKINYDRVIYRRENILNKLKSLKRVNNKNIDIRTQLFKDMGYK